MIVTSKESKKIDVRATANFGNMNVVTVKPKPDIEHTENFFKVPSTEKKNM